MADRTHTKIVNVSYYVRDRRTDSVSYNWHIFLKKLLTISINVFMIMPFILRESLSWSFTHLSKKQTKVKVILPTGKYVCSACIALVTSRIICYPRPIKPKKYVCNGAENEKISHKIILSSNPHYQNR